MTYVRGHIKGKSRIRILADCVEIQLNTGDLAYVDIADLHFVQGRAWVADVTKRGGNIYARGKFGNKRKALHRVIMDAPPDKQVDHRDGNGLNCRRANLRIATSQQNRFNCGASANNRAGIKGAAAAPYDRWKAQIQIGGRQTYLGTFDTPEEAGAAYIAAAESLHGDFAFTRGVAADPTGGAA